jgi:hypothetical protein
VTLNPGKDDGPMPVVINPAATPGTYTVVLRAQAQIPYNKDPKGQKQPINVVLPATPVTFTVLPKQVATLSLGNGNPTVKAGDAVELVVRVARMYDYGGDFKVQVILPPPAQGLVLAEATIPAGKDETKVLLKVASDAAPGARPEMMVRATALLNGNVPTVHEVKFVMNVVK